MFLVTGVNGLVGSAIARELLSQGMPLVGFGQGPQRNAYLGAFAYESVDLVDATALERALARHRPTAVIHCAAMTAVDRCESERELAWTTNVEPTRVLAAWCHSRAARLVVVSTDYVFDGRRAPYKETDGIFPLCVYAKTKAAAELAALVAHPSAVIARTSIPFGNLAHVKKDFVRWLTTELEAKRPVRIVTDQISCPTLVDDLAETLIMLAKGTFVGVVHTAGPTGISRFDFAQLIARVRKLDASLISPIQTEELKQPAQRPRDARLDVSLARSLGAQLTELEAGLVSSRGSSQ